MPSNRIVFGASVWNFIRVAGHPDLPGQTLMPVEKRGVDGIAFLEMEFKAEASPIYLTGLAVNYADLVLFRANIKNLQGTQIDLYTSTGLPYSGVVVKAVTLMSTKFQRQALWYGVSYPNSYKITWQMTVQYPYGSF